MAKDDPVLVSRNEIIITLLGTSYSVTYSSVEVRQDCSQRTLRMRMIRVSR
jgi:hypothetical protein